jgi:hypothetical protein
MLRLCVFFVALAGCATTPIAQKGPPLLPGDPNAPSQVTPEESLAIARAYCKHPWRPFARNILHGNDSTGIRVDTPDVSFRPANGRKGWWVPGEVNTGVPYKWGGYDDLASFDKAVANGLASGDVSSPAKRAADNAAVSACAAGVDCSGFVSRCLKLPTIHDSAQLPLVCDPLPDARDMRPGDVLNIPRTHSRLFAGWARKDKSWIYFYETGGVPDWKPALKEAPLDKILALGYTPMRYKGMAREEVPSGKEILTRAMREEAVLVPEPTIGDP